MAAALLVRIAFVCCIRRECHDESSVTCKHCAVPMKELKGHIYHKKRKWRCPKCNRIKMQAQKPSSNLR